MPNYALVIETDTHLYYRSIANPRDEVAVDKATGEHHAVRIKDEVNKLRPKNN